MKTNSNYSRPSGNLMKKNNNLDSLFKYKENYLYIQLKLKETLLVKSPNAKNKLKKDSLDGN